MSEKEILAIRKRIAKNNPFKGYINELPKKLNINKSSSNKYKIVFIPMPAK